MGVGVFWLYHKIYETKMCWCFPRSRLRTTYMVEATININIILVCYEYGGRVYEPLASFLCTRQPVQSVVCCLYAATTCTALPSPVEKFSPGLKWPCEPSLFLDGVGKSCHCICGADTTSADSDPYSKQYNSSINSMDSEVSTRTNPYRRTNISTIQQ